MINGVELTSLVKDELDKSTVLFRRHFVVVLTTRTGKYPLTADIKLSLGFRA